MLPVLTSASCAVTTLRVEKMPGRVMKCGTIMPTTASMLSRARQCGWFGKRAKTSKSRDAAGRASGGARWRVAWAPGGTKVSTAIEFTFIYSYLYISIARLDGRSHGRGHTFLHRGDSGPRPSLHAARDAPRYRPQENRRG